MSHKPLKFKIFTTIVLVSMVLSIVSPVLLYPKPAQAFSPGVIAVNTAKWIWEQVQKGWGFAQKIGAAQMAINVGNLVAHNMAIQMATDLASGGQGQRPLFYMRPFDEYLEQAGDEAMGEFIGQLSKPLEEIGINLCEPAYPEIRLSLRLAVLGMAEPELRKPRCDYTQIKENWRQMTAGEITEHMMLQWEPAQNDLGRALTLMTELKEQKAANELAAMQARAGENLKGIEDKVSGWIKTPATFIEEQLNEWLVRKPSALIESNKIISAISEWPIAGPFITAFTQTFLAKLTQRIMTKGLVSVADLYQGKIDFLAEFYGEESEPAGPGRKEAEAVLADIKIAPVSVGGQLDLTSQFSICPANPGFYNCVIDHGFVQAVNEKLTVGEALARGLLHGDWVLIGSGNYAANTNPTCYTSAYCSANLAKLRRARIIPVGWEFAAEVSEEKGGVALKDIVDQFSTEDSSFEHMVDPNWVLKEPAHQCLAETYGELLVSSQAGTRQKYCTDIASCLNEDADGNCQGAWGYCTREKNIWRLGGDECPDYYDSCQTFVRWDGKRFNYIANSLDFDDCGDPHAAGCKWFSTWQNEDDSWDEEQRIYLNHNADGCETKSEGCHHLIELANFREGEITSCDNYLANGQRDDYFDCLEDIVSQVTSDPKNKAYANYASVDDLYIKRALDYLGCLGRTPNHLASINEDGTSSGEGVINGEPEEECIDDGEYWDGNDCYLVDPDICKNFALRCEKEEVGCEKYTPINGDPWVPGIAEKDNYCPAECVGFQEFREMPTNFDPGQDAVPLIPNGTTCSAQDAGCAEFTNLDEVFLGGEGLEYYTYIRHCFKLDSPGAPDPNCKTYYTWVGSETTGYQLKSYYLQKTDDGAPAESPSPLEEIEYGQCETEADAIANPHCRIFYDADGNTFPTIYELTISCSADCHPLRKTVFPPAGCEQTGGQTQADGSCVYMVIPQEGRTCAKANAGCREYKGNAGNNIRNVFEDDFEQGIGDWLGGEISSESVNLGGHSIKVINPTAAIAHPISNVVSQGKSYIVSFWTKGIGTYRAAFTADITPPLQIGEKYIDTNGEWVEVKLGPVYFNREVKEDEKLLISSSEGNYFDKIILKEINNIYMLKNSWNVPDTCIDPDHLGCMAYRDRANKVHYLSSFSKLCREEAAGCSALVDTKNSSYPASQDFNSGSECPEDDITIEADSLTYLVNDSKKYCPAGDKGCQKLGLPKFNQEDEIEDWQTFFLKNNPDQYDNEFAPILCSCPFVGCESYNNGTSFFKDPELANKLCEYKENVVITEETVTGWFKKGTNRSCSLDSGNVCLGGDEAGMPCYPATGCAAGGGVCEEKFATDMPICISGAEEGKVCQEDGDCPEGKCQLTHIPKFLLPKNNASDYYQGFAGLCPGNMAGCTMFIDPASTEEIIVNGDFDSIDSWQTANGWNTIYYHDWSDNKPVYISADKVIEPGYPWEYNPNPPPVSYLPDPSEVRQEVDLVPDALYQVSAKVKGYAYEGTCPAGSANNVRIYLRVVDVEGGAEVEPIEGFKYYGTGKSDLDSSYSLGTEEKTISLKFYARKGGKAQLILQGTGGCDANGNNGRVVYKWVKFEKLATYYFLNNEHLDKTSCNGQVARKAGCVLFNDTSQSQNNWNAQATYYKSSHDEAKNLVTERLVSPVDCQNNHNHWACEEEEQESNNTNVILKVRLDRVCSQWLVPKSGNRVYDPRLQKYVINSSSLRLCDKLSKRGGGYFCEHGVSEGEAPREVLDKDFYIGSFTGAWESMDYSGYSIPDIYPVQYLNSVNISSPPAEPDWKLVYDAGVECETSCSLTCADGSTATCKSHRCVCQTDGSGFVEDEALVYSCRGYPEEDSPFPKELKGAVAFERANTCQHPLPNYPDDCECDYDKLGSIAQESYFSFESEVAMICTDGSELRIGTECGSGPLLDDCGDPDICGTGLGQTQCCQRLRKKSHYIGWKGYCLENDISNISYQSTEETKYACLTWLPVQSIRGARDVYDNYTSAGYAAASNRKWYCVGRVAPSEIKINKICYDPAMSSSLCIDYEYPGYGEASNFFTFSSSTSKCNGLWEDWTVCGDLDCQDQGYNEWCLLPEHLIGCYEVADTDNGGIYKHGCCKETNAETCFDAIGNGSDNGAGQVFYNWTGAEIYEYQIAEIKMHINSENNMCLTEEGDCWESSTTMTFNKEGDWYVIWCPSQQGGIKAIIHFDNNNKLSQIEIRASDGNDEGEFFIDKFEIYLKAGCNTLFKLFDNNGMTVAYTNRVMGTWDEPPSVCLTSESNLYNGKNSIGLSNCPWGATALSGSNPSDIKYLVYNGEGNDVYDLIGESLAAQGQVISYTNDICKLFPKFESKYILDTNDLKYSTDGGTPTCTYSAYSPEIYSLDVLNYNDHKKLWPEKQEGQVTINDTNGPVQGTANYTEFVMQFFGYADKNQMPIRSVEVDWDGDGSYDTVREGKIKNHRGLKANEEYEYTCASSPEEASNFGVSPSACANSEFYFTYVYSELNEEGYHPRVKIKDNWGKESIFGDGNPANGGTGSDLLPTITVY